MAGKGGSLFLDDISSIVASAALLFLLGLLLEINYYFWFIQAIIDVLRNCKKRYVFYGFIPKYYDITRNYNILIHLYNDLIIFKVVSIFTVA